MISFRDSTTTYTSATNPIDSTCCSEDADDDKVEESEAIDIRAELEWERRNWRAIQKKHNFHQTKWGHNKPRCQQ